MLKNHSQPSARRHQAIAANGTNRAEAGTETGNHRMTAIAAGTVGNILEWYDFALYGFMASVLSGLFFPAENHLVSLMATYGVFAVGFIMRPLGSVLFGWFGDTFGRSRTLVISVAMMSLPTFLLGTLPDYAVAGALAPLLLILVRMVQGLSVGGEFSTSVTYLVETAPSGRRGFAGSWANIGSLGGMLLGSAAAAAVTNLVSAQALLAWGWRIPFIGGGLAGGVITLLMHRGLPQSPELARYERARCPNSPLREAFNCNRTEMIQGSLFAAAYGALFYLALVYLPVWVNETTGMPLGTAMEINTITLGLLIPVIPIAGWISDRYIRRTRLLVAAFFVLGIVGTLSLAGMRSGALLPVVIGQVVTGLLLAIPMGVAPALFTELFPEDDRLTGYSIVFNVGLGIVGGLTPLAASWLILQTGTDLAPIGLIILVAALGITALLWMQDRSREPLATTCAIPINEAVKGRGCTCAERGVA